MKIRQFLLLCLGTLFLGLIISGCAPGNTRFIETAAGFWAGLWHGLISLFTFIISLFSDTVRMYEVNNTGEWYDFGFLLGAMIILGGSCRKQIRRRGGVCQPRAKDWEVIATRVQEGVREGIRDWAEKHPDSVQEWQELAHQISEQIKRDVGRWSRQ